MSENIKPKNHTKLEIGTGAHELETRDDAVEAIVALTAELTGTTEQDVAPALEDMLTRQLREQNKTANWTPQYIVNTTPQTFTPQAPMSWSKETPRPNTHLEDYTVLTSSTGETVLVGYRISEDIEAFGNDSSPDAPPAYATQEFGFAVPLKEDSDGAVGAAARVLASRS